MSNIEKLAEIHREALDDIGFQLATNFEVPAPRLINVAIAKMGITRVEYEQIVCHRNGWEYEPIPRHILNRWATY